MVVESRKGELEKREACKRAYRTGFIHGALALLFFLALIGGLTSCSTIAHASVPAGWPDLKVTEHKVSFSEMYSRCKKYVGFGDIPFACAEWNFDESWCRIYYVFDWTLEHEREHCKGKSHVGDSVTADSLNKWRGR